jgi:hypothetical protein
MNCTKTLGLVGIAIMLTGLAAAPVRAGDAPSATFTKCAKACADCQLACDACFHHCTELTAGGAKEHAGTLQLCFACGEFCSLSAKLVAARSPLARQACEACAKACDECGAACGKYPEHKIMADCAKSCDSCAKACREMIEQLGK